MSEQISRYRFFIQSSCWELEIWIFCNTYSSFVLQYLCLSSILRIDWSSFTPDRALLLQSSVQCVSFIVCAQFYSNESLSLPHNAILNTNLAFNIRPVQTETTQWLQNSFREQINGMIWSLLSHSKSTLNPANATSQNRSPILRRQYFKRPVLFLRVWPTSLLVLYRTKSHRSVFSIVSTNFVTSVRFQNTYSWPLWLLRPPIQENS